MAKTTFSGPVRSENNYKVVKGISIDDFISQTNQEIKTRSLTSQDS